MINNNTIYVNAISQVLQKAEILTFACGTRSVPICVKFKKMYFSIKS